MRPCSGTATDPDGSAQCPSPRCHTEILRHPTGQRSRLMRPVRAPGVSASAVSSHHGHAASGDGYDPKANNAKRGTEPPCDHETSHACHRSLK